MRFSEKMLHSATEPLRKIILQCLELFDPNFSIELAMKLKNILAVASWNNEKAIAN